MSSTQQKQKKVCGQNKKANKTKTPKHPTVPYAGSFGKLGAGRSNASAASANDDRCHACQRAARGGVFGSSYQKRKQAAH